MDSISASDKFFITHVLNFVCEPLFAGSVHILRKHVVDGIIIEFEGDKGHDVVDAVFV